MGLSPFLKFSEPQLFHLLVVFMLPLFISSPVTEKGLELSIVSLSTLKLLKIAIYCHCNGIAVEIRNILLPKLINILQSISYLTALRYLTFLTTSSFLLRLWMIFPHLLCRHPLLSNFSNIGTIQGSILYPPLSSLCLSRQVQHHGFNCNS